MQQTIEFASNHPLLVSALLASYFLLVFSELRRKSRGLTHIEPLDAVKLINADAVVIDLRSADAFARGHIVNARNIPLDELDANQDKITRFGSQEQLESPGAYSSEGETAKPAETEAKNERDFVYNVIDDQNNKKSLKFFFVLYRCVYRWYSIFV